jgi:DNA-binding beta-propeller fold protein YncE
MKPSIAIPFLVALLAAIGVGGYAAPCRAADLLVSDQVADSVLRYDGSTGRFIDIFASGSGLAATQAILFGPDGNLYVGNIFGNAGDSVLRFDGRTGAFLDVFVPPQSGGLAAPQGMVFGPDGNLYVSSLFDEVLRYDGTTGAFIDTFVHPSSGGLNCPTGLAFGPDLNLYVASFCFPTSIRRYDRKTGAFIDEFVPAGRGGLSSPFAMIFGADNNLYVSSAGSDSILRYDGVTGAFVDAFVPAGSGGLSFPGGLVFGPDGNLYVSSVNPPGKVLRYDGTTGAFIDAFVPNGRGGLGSPVSLAFTPEPASRRLTALRPARLWMGLRNSDDVGVRFDLRAEVFVGADLIGTGELSGASGGSSGFNNARVDEIPLTLFRVIDLPDNAKIKITISARTSCAAPGHHSGTARLWYGGNASVKNPMTGRSAADSRFAVTIGAGARLLFLEGGFALGASPGTTTAKTIDRSLNTAIACPLRPFTALGTWSTSIP